jgi:MoxR-like ATPase
MADRKNLLKVFEAHGVEFTGQRGDQVYGYCPFSGKEDKFYVNTKNGLWDSKTAGLSGNVAQFLHHRSRSYRAEITSAQLRALSENRQLARDAFRDWEIGWDGKSYTWPVRDYEGNVVDIRRFSIRGKLILSTAGAHVGLLGAHRLKGQPNDPVYLCEGEWDTMALHWLLRSLNEPGVVVGVPGAGTFKDEWVNWLNGRTVHTLYDADTAGEEGEAKVNEKLKGATRKLTYVHWPDDVPPGFDTRDWIVYGATLRKTPEVCLERLIRRFEDHPKNAKTETGETKGRIVFSKKKKKVDQWKVPPTLEQVHETFSKWLFLRGTDVIDLVMATVLSQRIDGSPAWLFLVGPPGSAKTAIISSIKDVAATYFTSALTAPSLISGANFQGGGGGDPSLIPKLNGKVLVVKDFTSILSLPDREQKEIFGILRDAYDGYCAKTFGNGISRSYESRFTVLAATTPKIYDLAESHQSLGERFLKFLVGDNLHHLSEDEVITRAIENADRESAMHAELSSVTKAFIERTREKVKAPELPDRILQKIVALAKFGARMRGTVSRDFYRNDIVMSRPMAEVGTRLGQQLAKLARGLAMVHNRASVNDDDYVLIKKVMLDTISQRNEDVLREMVQAMGGTEKMTAMSMRELALKTHYPFPTIQRLMQDLASLQIIKRQGAGVGTTWTLTDYVKKEIRDSELYTASDLNRQSIGRIRLIKKRAKEHPRKIRLVKPVLKEPPSNPAVVAGIGPRTPAIVRSAGWLRPKS